MNYEKLGFMCGIEIHQQLATDSKLFCNCPIEMEDEAANHQFERFLKSVAGETGEEDEAARVESKKSRKFVYNYYKRNNCLVEIDEEPPHEINQEALDTGLTFARMVDADIPQEIQVMRKMVVDGSNTSGFQRTSMIGLNGELETETGAVSIEDIELEEESSGIHERTQETAVYDLNRLGIPLIEVGTDASIKNAKHAREVAKKIGMLLRSTNKARRGLGTIRQDVNVSIEKGSRVEIKGFQDVENIDKLIEYEVQRQKKLVEIGENTEYDETVGDNVTHIFEDTGNDIVSTVLQNDGAVYAVKIPNMTGKMKKQICGDRYVAKELVDYAKTRGLNGIIHTDEDIDKYGLREEFDELENIFEKEDEDVLAILAGSAGQAREAAKAVQERAEKLLKAEIPEETRNAEQDFTTSYSRPLPGSARMYPETDIPAIEITDEKIKEIDQNLPETLEEREEKYTEEIGEELASQIVSSKRLTLFEAFKDQIDPKIVANIFTNVYAQLESEGVPIERLQKSDYQSVIDALESERIRKGDIEDVLEKMAENPHSETDQVIEDVMDNKANDEEIREVVKEIIEQKSEMIEEQGMHAQGALMGQVMGRVEADGGTVSQILQEELQKVM